jgi:hypothetical protein
MVWITFGFSFMKVGGAFSSARSGGAIFVIHLLLEGTVVSRIFDRNR